MRWAILAIACGCTSGDKESEGSPDGDPTGDDTDTPIVPTDPPTDPTSGELAMTVLATGLSNPFEVIPAADGYLWVTERTIGRVTRVSSTDGTLAPLLDVDDILITEYAQDGLLGMALAPDFLTGGGPHHLWLAYTYDGDPAADVALRRVKIVRYTYDEAAGTLGEPMVVLSDLHGSNDHNTGRLLYGPDGRLYYSIGDQGNNQRLNFCTEIAAQQLPTATEIDTEDWTAYQGKVLRIDLDGGIPDDNPVIEGVRSHIWTWGHRNGQGLAFGADGTLYEAEHGPKSDDELNVLVAGGNYGWPRVAGYQDDQAYAYGNWSASVDPPCASLLYNEFEIPPSVPILQESSFTGPHVDPVRTFYTVEDDFEFMDPDCAEDELYFLCYPSLAPSSLAVYAHPDGIAFLDRSLLMTSLKLGNLYRLDLDDLAGEPELLFHTVDRYRHISASPDGKTLYLATDAGGYALDDDGTPTDVMTHLGAILALTLEVP